MKVVNLTPHAVTLMPAGPEGPQVVLPPSGVVARCATTREKIDTVDLDGVQIPVNQTSFGDLEGLPEPQDGVMYVVSALAAQAAVKAGRTDVLIVDDAVRDEAGRIVGARALARP